MFWIGTGKADITAFFKGVGMLGYGLPQHHMLGVETPLYARSFVIEQADQSSKICLVNCELAFITPSVKQAVLSELEKNFPAFGYTSANLLLTAQHTHCGPSGFSYHILYNISTPGFHTGVFEKIVNGIVKSIAAAEQHKQKATIKIGKSVFGDDIPVSFNRTVDVYNLNPEVKKQTMETRHLAVDREMTLLHFISEKGQPLGSVNWFAVHTSNCPNNFLKVCSDNKGFAATALEEELKKENSNYIAAFAQGACGDVSARVKFNPKLPAARGKWEGYFQDDLKSAKFNGKLQFEKAKEIIDDSPAEIKNETVESILAFVDFSNISIDPAYTNGLSGCVTSPSCMGVSFLEGSLMDGPGLPQILGKFARTIARNARQKEKKDAAKTGGDYAEFIGRKHKAQAVKDIGVASGERKFLGNFDADRIPLPAFSDETILNIKKLAKQGAFNYTNPWSPQILSLQIVQLGTIAICAFPFEITTVASWRLKKTLEDGLKNKGVDYVILCPYANEYNGYITTYEEYQAQEYEGGHNVFGQWSLNALQQKFAELAHEFSKQENIRTVNNLQQESFTEEEIEKQLHYASRRERRLMRKERKSLKK